jgi:MraZ protein
MDTKGRFSLPAEHRRELPENLLIARAPQKEFPHLRIYGAKQYDEWVTEVLADAEKYAASYENREQVRAARDYLRSQQYARTEKASWDEAGRLRISKDLRDYAALDKQVVVLGAGTHVQVWNAAELEKYRKHFEDINPFNLP